MDKGITASISPDEKIALWLGWTWHDVDGEEGHWRIWTNGNEEIFDNDAEHHLNFSKSIDTWHKHGLFDEIERRLIMVTFMEAVYKRIEWRSDTLRRDFKLLGVPASVLADALCEVIE